MLPGLPSSSRRIITRDISRVESSLDGLDDIAVFDLFFFRRASRLDRNYGRVSIALGDVQSNLCRAFAAVLLIGFVFVRGQVAGVADRATRAARAGRPR